VGARTKGREAALQMLFAAEASGEGSARVQRDFWAELPGDPEGRSFADELMSEVLERQADLDRLIAAASEHWRIERMTRVDRNVLRIAAFELAHRPDTPRAVILDEAVDLAKRYGSEDSGAFVNGVLTRVADECGRVDEATRQE
jgi:N utilization substance protein B